MAGASATVHSPATGIDPEVVICSYYRDAELRGSNLIYRLLRILEDPESQVFLSEHLADETRHAWLWTERIRELGSAPIRVDDGYQVRIGKRAGVPRHPVDLLALTVVVEPSTGTIVRPVHLNAKGFADDPAVFDEALRLVEENLKRALADGEFDPHRLSQIIRRTVGKWVSDTHRRRPMIIPTVLEV